LHLEELSLVDRPANAQAMVSLFKRDNSFEGINKMNEEMETKVAAYMKDKGCGRADAMKALGYDMEKAEEVKEEVAEKSEAEEVNPLEAEVETLKAENETLRKGLIDNGYVITADAIEKKAEVEFLEYEGDKINKADIPAPILKALEEAEFAKADLELTTKAEEALPNFDVATAKELVKSFETNEEVMGVLKAADKAFGSSMEEVGKADVDGEFTTASDKLDALVKSYMDTNEMKKSEYAVAYSAVAKTDEGKALITKSYKGE
jgi:hypothetical protein